MLKTKTYRNNVTGQLMTIDAEDVPMIERQLKRMNAKDDPIKGKWFFASDEWVDVD